MPIPRSRGNASSAAALQSVHFFSINQLSRASAMCSVRTFYTPCKFIRNDLAGRSIGLNSIGFGKLLSGCFKQASNTIVLLQEIQISLGKRQDGCGVKKDCWSTKCNYVANVVSRSIPGN